MSLVSIWAASLLLLPPTGEAATLSGRLTGPDGMPIADARVEVVEVHRHVTTDADGRYRVAGLPSGVYRVSFSAIGFRPVVRRVTIADQDVTLDVSLSPSVVEIPALQVTASPLATSALESPQPLSVLSGEALRTQSRPTLGETLELLPGLRNWSTGAGIGKPVIRGLSSNRVVVLSDGQRLESQQWGDEHGPNVETADAERIEVIRGPASVLYGSDAIGGVVNVVHQPLPDAIGEDGFVRGSASAAYGTNRRAPDGLLTLEGATGGLGFRGAVSGRRSADIRTPAGLLQNSGYETWGGSLGTGYRGTWGSFSLDYSGRKERVEIHEDPDEEPDFSGFQRITNDRLRGGLKLPVGGSSRLEVIAGWERNNRREYDDVDAEAAGEIELGLRSKSLTGDLRLHHVLGRFGGTAGLSLLRNSFTGYGEETLIPDSDYTNLGVFLFEQTDAGPWSVSFGARYDYRRLSIEDNDALDLDAEDRSYSSLTGNLGLLYRVSEPVAFVVNVGRGYRAPTTFELYSDGVHEGTVRYERGDPTLRNETSFNADLALRLQAERVHFEVGGFHNRVSNFIYPDPTGTFDPESGFQIYDIVQGDATFTGFEAAAEIHPSERIHLRAGADYTRAQNTALDQPLPFVPPFRLTWGIRWEGPGAGTLREPYLDLGGETNTEQTRLDPEDFAPPGYTLVQVGGGFGLALGRQELKLDLTVRNLFDTEYTNFMSRYKLYALDAGRNIVFRVTTTF
jgi:iron complex outermembrane recepter protein